MDKIVGILAALFLGTASAAAVSITECNQLVPRGEVGVLAGDLSCVGGVGVRLDPRATLDLAGFTIEMSDVLGFEYAVGCADFSGGLQYAGCTVTSSGSPGTLRGDGAASHGILGGNVRIQNVTIEGFGNYGIQATKKVLAESVTVSDAQQGIRAEVVRAVDLTLTDNDTGVFAQRLRASQVSASGNIEGLVAIKGMRGDGISVSGSTNGLRVHRGLRLRSSTITGNTVDLRTGKRPRVTDVTCTVSQKITPPDESWGVCSGD
jgi:hypothetical protein